MPTEVGGHVAQVRDQLDERAVAGGWGSGRVCLDSWCLQVCFVSRGLPSKALMGASPVLMYPRWSTSSESGSIVEGGADLASARPLHPEEAGQSRGASLFVPLRRATFAPRPVKIRGSDQATGP